MHELGIVFHIIRTAEDVARQNDVTRIRRVTLQPMHLFGSTTLAPQPRRRAVSILT